MVKPTNINNQTKATEFFVGKTYKVIKNTHVNFPIGSVFRCSRVSFGNPTYLFKENGGNDYIIHTAVELCPITIKELKQQIIEHEIKSKTIKSDILNLKLKIKFLKENKLEQFDENEFKVYQTLEVLDDPELTKIQRAKEIAKLINN